MPTSRGFLERFRPSGTPGAAARGGVPADRVGERSAELAALFDLLAPTEAEAALVRARALEEAERRLVGSAARVARRRAEAVELAEEARRAAAEQVAAVADTEVVTIAQAAEEDVARIRQHAEQVTPRFARRVLTGLAADFGLDPSAVEESTGRDQP